MPSQFSDKDIETFFDQVRAANARIEDLRGEMVVAAAMKAAALIALRQQLSVIEIAERLGVSRQAIYDALEGAPQSSKKAPGPPWADRRRKGQ
jgi:Homeodomain-like domain